MPSVNIAFSAGLESMAMAVKALRMGLDINLCVIHVANNPETYMFEVYHTTKIVEKIKELQKFDPGLKGKINQIIIKPEVPYAPALARYSGDEESPLVCNSVNQQFAVLLGMMDVRRYVLRENPAVWIGWLSQDTAEHSFNLYDHTDQDYKDLLNLPKVLGRVSNSDRVGNPFFAPLWDMSKRDVYLSIPKELLEMVIHTGSGNVNLQAGTISYNIYQNKRKECIDAGMPVEFCNESMEYKLTDIPLSIRMLCGAVYASDVKLPATADNMVQRIARRIGGCVKAWRISDLSWLSNELTEVLESTVNTVNEFADIRYPTEKEKAIQYYTELFAEGTTRKVRVYEEEGTTIMEVAGSRLRDMPSELLEQARRIQATQEKAKRNLELEDQVEVLQDGSDEHATGDWNDAVLMKVASPTLIEEEVTHLPENHPMLGGGVNPLR